jgi:hypothetical protein
MSKTDVPEPFQAGQRVLADIPGEGQLPGVIVGKSGAIRWIVHLDDGRTITFHGIDLTITIDTEPTPPKFTIGQRVTVKDDGGDRWGMIGYIEATDTLNGTRRYYVRFPFPNDRDEHAWLRESRLESREDDDWKVVDALGNPIRIGCVVTHSNREGVYTVVKVERRSGRGWRVRATRDGGDGKVLILNPEYLTVIGRYMKPDTPPPPPPPEPDPVHQPHDGPYIHPKFDGVIGSIWKPEEARGLEAVTERMVKLVMVMSESVEKAKKAEDAA